MRPVAKPGSPPKNSELDTIAARVQSEMGVKLVYGVETPYFPYITSRPAPMTDFPQVARYAKLLEQELNRYSQFCLKKINLKTVIICKDVAIDKVTSPGVAEERDGTLIMDYKMGDYDEAYQRHVIHHELLHYMIGLLYPGPPYTDSEWPQYNAPGTKYGRGGQFARDPYEEVLNHPKLGFVDAYAQSGPDEDMAELHACRMVPKEFEMLKEWMKHDRYLEAKYERLLKLLEPLGAA